jgi:N-acetylmuramoyl-L-alanine amidase
MKIQDHQLVPENDEENIRFEKTPNQSGPFNDHLPDTIIIHYTGGNSIESSVNWLKNPKANASAHVVVGKTGEIVQMVPLNIIAWHAGASRWKGRQRLNNYSIGIEIDNAGLLEKRAEGYYTYFDKRMSNQKVVLARHKHGDEEKAWEAYNEKQIATVEEICRLLKDTYNINEILGHDDVAPGRKIDPGPAFPLQKLQDKILFGRTDENPYFGDLETSMGYRGVVTAEYLNIRSKPNISSLKITDPLPRGTRVKILKQKNEWFYVDVDISGWVHKNWIKTS